MANLLSDALDIKSCHKLSIKDIDRYWNYESHRSAGRIRYKSQFNATALTESQQKMDPLAQFKELTNEFSKRGKWQSPDGTLTDDINFTGQLLELAKRGALKIYAGAESNEPPCRTSDLQNITPEKIEKYFIGRDELGCFLVSSNKPLPNFWYTKADVKIYEDRLERQNGESIDLKNQLDQALKEISQLTKLVAEKLPCLDPSHPFFSSELEAAITAWLENFGNKASKDDLAPQKPKLELWLKENRSKLVLNDKGGANKSMLDRITKLINPDHVKGGGRPTDNKED